MKSILLRYLLGIGVFSSIGVGYVPSAHAGTFHEGWNYTIDSFNDGFDGQTIGQMSQVELYGMAMREDDESVYFAFNSNLSLDGLFNKHAHNRRISYGDLFLNFTNPQSFNTAPERYGIRFDALNDSRVSLGVYRGVLAAGFTRANLGFANLVEAQTAIQSQGGSVSYGDLEMDTPYFDLQSAAPTTMYGGTRVGDIELITDFTDLHLDFGTFGATGQHTFGIRIDRQVLPSETFVAHLFIESGNDGVALQGSLGQANTNPSSPNQEIPEPSSVMGIGLMGLMALWRRYWHHGQVAA